MFFLKEENDQYSDRLLEKLWPVLSDPSTKVADGAFHFEKYMLLADPALNEEDIGPVAAQIVEKEGLYLDLAFVLLQRALPSVEAVLRTELQKARSAKSVVRFVCTLACLQTYGDEAAPDLADFLSSESWLDEPAEKVLRQLLAKLRQGGKIRYADLEEIEYRESRESRGGSRGQATTFENDGERGRSGTAPELPLGEVGGKRRGSHFRTANTDKS